jgi:DNA-binding MarR family transcriptional regulator
MNMGRPAGKDAISMRTFLSKLMEAYKNNHNQSWIAKELGVTPAAVSLRISKLREKGVKIPELVSGRGGSNTVEDANDILAELGFDG